jgi:hypothetical protein
MRITHFASAGAADPTRASIPLHLAANGSVELGHEVSTTDVPARFADSDRVVSF